MTAEERLTPAEKVTMILRGWGYGDGKTSEAEINLVHFWLIFSSHLKKLISWVMDPDANNPEIHVSGDDELEGVFELLKHNHFYDLLLESVNDPLKEKGRELISRFELDHAKPSIRLVR